MDLTYHYETDHVRELSIWGYLRDIFTDRHNYTDIILMVLQYHKEGYAKYYDEKVDKDYKQKMRFGDILRTKDDELIVLDIDNQSIAAGHLTDCFYQDIEFYIRIPFAICQHLSDAVRFYSKFDNITLFQYSEWYELSLTVKHNDAWIVKHFHGPLSNKYKSIKVQFENNKLYGVTISDGGGFTYLFDPRNESITDKYVAEHFIQMNTPKVSSTKD